MGSSDVLLLGPYPGNGSFSTWNYYSLCRDHLAEAAAPISIRSACPGVVSQKTPSVAHREWRGSAWIRNYLEWPLRLKMASAGAYHMVDQGLAWYGRFLPPGKRLVTVHDLINWMVIRDELDMPAVTGRRKWLVQECARQIGSAHHILAISRHTADCIMRSLGVEGRRISLTPNCVDRAFRPLPDKSGCRRKWFGEAEIAVLSVGNTSPYKNRIASLRALAELRRIVPEARMWGVHGLPTEAEARVIKEKELADCVVYLPVLRREELVEVYNAADLLIFPSAYEGFGVPPLEAMACGCPVVSTTRASLAEVAAGAALTVEDPKDYQGMARHLHTILTDRTVREELKELGFRRAAQFSAENAVARVAEVYKEVLC